MKALKGYFLFFSEHPIAYNFIGILLNLVYLAIIFAISPDQEDFSAPKFYHLINILFVLNIILIYFVSSKFITRKRNYEADEFEEYSSEWFRIIILENGEKIIIDKPFWGKGKVYFVKTPNRSIREILAYTYSIKIKGKYKNSNMSISVSIVLETDDQCNRIEIFEALYNLHLLEKDEGNCLDLSDYLEYTFKKFNDKFQPDFDELTRRYAIMEISEPYLLSNIIDMIIFPERIFSNIKNVEICLSNPTFSSCKGMVDC